MATNRRLALVKTAVMFDRRLKIFLLILCSVTLILMARALQIQVLGRAYWSDRARETMKRTELLETTRGALLDYKGREIAVEVACIDACVDYRAIPYEPDEQWLRDQALLRLRAHPDGAYKASAKPQRALLLADEIARVKTDIQIMYAQLARCAAGPDATDDDIRAAENRIDETRRLTERRVGMRQRYVWYKRYEAAKKRFEQRDPPPAWKRWLIDESAQVPNLDSFNETVAEQTHAHIILRAIDGETHNFLAKNLEKFPGLQLRPSTHRIYPYNEAGCHLIGHQAGATREDIENDKYAGIDELRQYYPNDLVGRTGLEALAEATLRGKRGKIDRIVGDVEESIRSDPEPGIAVRTTIDIELQRELQLLFKSARVQSPDGTIAVTEMHGAAVVIDVKSGEVRALASYPAFDLNSLDENYSRLASDELDRPLFNRATMNQLEPGSTMKLVVGLSAITGGYIDVKQGIECTGYLVLPMKGQPHKFREGRCWVASKFEKQIDSVAHHPIPSAAPHVGRFGNPDGTLVLSDALERSCNIYFETLGDRMGIDGLSEWMERFGLGRPTGLGIAEASGRLPRGYKGPNYLRRMTSWFSAIGQGEVAATPIQMANVAATIARDGVWLRPRLLADESGRDSSRETRSGEDRVDLKLSPDALAEAKEGMIRVVDSRAGTGRVLNHIEHGGQFSEERVMNVTLAGKTGTAQAAKYSIPLRDDQGDVVRDEKGRIKRTFLELWTPDKPTSTPWYRGTGSDGKGLDHAWFIGFAPAHDPQIAFCVLVEYGGSGGTAAGPIARDVLEACIEHGYLRIPSK